MKTIFNGLIYHRLRLESIYALGVFVFIFLSSFAGNAQQFGDYYCTTTSSNITIQRYSGAGGAVSIPDKINGLPVTSIGDNAFAFCASLTDVRIPNGVTNIGEFAFNSCSSLTSVRIPNSATSIGRGPFTRCASLTVITVDELNSVYCSVDGILFSKNQTSIFQCPGGKAGHYTIPNSVTNIGDSAFCGCMSLASVTLPSSVTSIGSEAFNNCSSLTAITVDTLNSVYSSVDGILFDKSQILLIQCPGGKTGNYTIPNSVTSIGNYAFNICASLTGVAIPNSVTNIGLMAFYNCTSLTSVTFPDSVTNIGDYAFCGCASLTNVTIPISVTSLSGSAFESCNNLTEITVDALNSAYSSVDGVLFNKSQTMLILCPGGKTGDYTIPSSVTFILNDAFFSSASLASITIPNSVMIFGPQRYHFCPNLSSLTIDMTDIGNFLGSPFGGMKNLTNLVIGNHVKYIGDYAFVGDTSLTSVTISYSVTHIGKQAFAHCDKLTSITVDSLNTAYSSADGVLLDKSQTVLIQCPGGTAGNYTIPNSVTSIGNSAFIYCANLTSVTIPNTVTNIEWGAFYYCSNLVGVIFKGNAPRYSVDVFDGNSNATVYYLPGTKGWGRSFDWRPTALWNVVVLNPSNLNQVYDGLPKVVMADTMPLGLALTITYNGSATPPTGAGNYSIVATVNDANYPGSASGTLKVLPVPLTVIGATAANKVYDGTTSATIDTAGATLNGVLAIDTGNVTMVSSGATGAFGDRNAGTNKPVTIGGLTLTGSAAANYTLSKPTTTANISALGLTVTGITAASKAFDGTTAAAINTSGAILNGVLEADKANVNLVTSGASGAFADMNVGTGKTVAISGLRLSGSAAGNYTLTPPTATANITAVPLTLTVMGITAVTKAYDGTTTATINTSGAMLNGLQPADAANVILVTSSATGAFADKNAGTGKTVAINGLTLSGSAVGNYTLKPPTATANIIAAGLMVTGIAAANKVYDGKTSVTISGTPSLVGVIGSDKVSLTGTATGAFSSKTVGNNKTVTVSSLSLGGIDAGNYTLREPGLTANITPAPLTVSGLAASGKLYDGTISATITGTPALAGVIGSDVVTANGTATGAFGSKTAGNYKAVTVTGLSLGGADSGNYTLNVSSLSANITPAPLTASGLTANDKVYDGTTNATFSGTPVLSGVISPDVVTVKGTANGIFASRNVGNNQTVMGGIALSGADAGNYRVSAFSLTANITPASLTVTANDTNRVYGAANPVFAGTITGLQGRDNITATYSCAATTNSPAGTYSIVSSLVDPGGNLANYTVVTKDGILTVTPQLASPTITKALLSGKTFSVVVLTETGMNYVFEYKNSLSDSNWTEVVTLPGTGETVTFADDAATGSSKIYRVRVQ